MTNGIPSNFLLGYSTYPHCAAQNPVPEVYATKVLFDFARYQVLLQCCTARISAFTLATDVHDLLLRPPSLRTGSRTIQGCTPANSIPKPGIRSLRPRRVSLNKSHAVALPRIFCVCHAISFFSQGRSRSRRKGQKRDYRCRQDRQLLVQHVANHAHAFRSNTWTDDSARVRFASLAGRACTAPHSHAHRVCADYTKHDPYIYKSVRARRYNIQSNGPKREWYLIVNDE